MTNCTLYQYLFHTRLPDIFALEIDEADADLSDIREQSRRLDARMAAYRDGNQGIPAADSAALAPSSSYLTRSDTNASAVHSRSDASLGGNKRAYSQSEPSDAPAPTEPSQTRRRTDKSISGVNRESTTNTAAEYHPAGSSSSSPAESRARPTPKNTPRPPSISSAKGPGAKHSLTKADLAVCRLLGRVRFATGPREGSQIIRDIKEIYLPQNVGEAKLEGTSLAESFPVQMRAIKIKGIGAYLKSNAGRATETSIVHPCTSLLADTVNDMAATGARLYAEILGDSEDTPAPGRWYPEQSDPCDRPDLVASNQAILEVKGNLEATVNWVLAKLDLHGSVEMICPPDASSFNDIRWDGRAVWDNSLTGIKQILIQLVSQMQCRQATYGALFDWDYGIVLRHGYSDALHTYTVFRPVTRSPNPTGGSAEESPQAMLYWLLHQMPTTHGCCLSASQVAREIKVIESEWKAISAAQNAAKIAQDRNDMLPPPPPAPDPDNGSAPGPHDGKDSDGQAGSRADAGSGTSGQSTAQGAQHEGRGGSTYDLGNPADGASFKWAAQTLGQLSESSASHDFKLDHRSLLPAHVSAHSGSPMPTNSQPYSWRTYGTGLSAYTLLKSTDLCPAPSLTVSASPTWISGSALDDVHLLDIDRLSTYNIHGVVLSEAPWKGLQRDRETSTLSLPAATSHPPSPPAGCTITFDSYAGHGGTWDAFEASLRTSGPIMPHTSRIIVKIFCPSTFAEYPRGEDGQVDKSKDWRQPRVSDEELDEQEKAIQAQEKADLVMAGQTVERGVLNEVWLYQNTLRSFGHAPDCHGTLWLQDPRSSSLALGVLEYYALLLQDCGTPPDKYQLRKYGSEIIQAFRDLHALGILHGDPQPWHIRLVPSQPTEREFGGSITPSKASTRTADAHRAYPSPVSLTCSPARESSQLFGTVESEISTAGDDQIDNPDRQADTHTSFKEAISLGEAAKIGGDELVMSVKIIDYDLARPLIDKSDAEAELSLVIQRCGLDHLTL